MEVYVWKNVHLSETSIECRTYMRKYFKCRTYMRKCKLKQIELAIIWNYKYVQFWRIKLIVLQLNGSCRVKPVTLIPKPPFPRKAKIQDTFYNKHIKIHIIINITVKDKLPNLYHHALPCLPRIGLKAVLTSYKCFDAPFCRVTNKKTNPWS